MLQLRKILFNTRAAIDLASVMVGIIIIGIIGGIIAATIFAIVPWAQDKQAKENLTAAKTAQDVYIGLAATGDLSVKPAFATPLLSLVNLSSVSAAAELNNTANFGTYDDLVNNKLIKKTKSLNMGKGTDGQCYVITSYSQTGRVFWYDSTLSGIKSYDVSTSFSQCAGTDVSKTLPQAYLDAQKPVTTPTPTPTQTSTPTTPPATTTPIPTTPPATPTPTPTETPAPVNDHGVPVGTAVYSNNFETNTKTGWLTKSTICDITADSASIYSCKYASLYSALSKGNKTKVLQTLDTYPSLTGITLQPGTYSLTQDATHGSDMTGGSWAVTISAKGNTTVQDSWTDAGIWTFTKSTHSTTFTVTTAGTYTFAYSVAGASGSSTNTRPYILDNVKIVKTGN
jgi:cell division septation protein DedD